MVLDIMKKTIIHLSFLCRLINPVVVAPTIAAVGLSFYSYGFPLVGTCIEIGVVQILLVILFSLVSAVCPLIYSFHMVSIVVLCFTVYFTLIKDFIL